MKKQVFICPSCLTMTDFTSAMQPHQIRVLCQGCYNLRRFSKEGPQLPWMLPTNPPKKGKKLVPCTGEAHGNAHIDNCGVCMPRWGWMEVDA